MLIRDYRSDDYPRIEALWKATGIYTEERGDTTNLIVRCNNMGGRFLVMEDPDQHQIVATSWLTWDGRRVLLHHFAVQPTRQCKGYGRLMAIESLAFAREKGCPLKLEVHRENLAAILLYKSLGFKAFENYDIYMILDP